MKDLLIGYSEDVVNYYNEFVNDINELTRLCRETPQTRRKKSSKGGNSADQFENVPADKKLCNILLKDIPAWTEWSVKVVDKAATIPISFIKCVGCVIGETTEFLLELIAQGVEYALNWIMERITGFINDKIIMKCLKYLNIVKLFVKKTMLIAEREVLKITKKMFESVKIGKFITGVNDAIVAIISTIVLVLEKGFMVIDIIEKVLGSTMLSLDGESMAFFMTPKTITTGMMKSDIAPINSKSSIFGGIMDLIYPYMDAMVNTVKQSNKAIKIATISSSVASAMAGGDVPDASPKLEELSTDAVINVISKIAYILFPEAEPLPKFERLHPGNLGFMIWQLTSFQLAMKKCFGLPGYP